MVFEGTTLHIVSHREFIEFAIALAEKILPNPEDIENSVWWSAYSQYHVYYGADTDSILSTWAKVQKSIGAEYIQPAEFTKGSHTFKFKDEKTLFAFKLKFGDTLTCTV